MRPELCSKKGFSGARMQEIADEAGINKAMLHYYFKQTTSFWAVFMNAFNQLSLNLFLILMHPFLKKQSSTITSHSSSTIRIYRRL
jgi:AcrR family transcriptional regulator